MDFPNLLVLTIALGPALLVWLYERLKGRRDRAVFEELRALIASREEELERVKEIRFEREKGDVDVGELEAGDAQALIDDVPEELIEACASGECVLMSGSGVPAQAGFPTWRETLQVLIDRAAASGEGESRNWSNLSDALRAGKLAEVEEVLSSRLPRELLIETARELYVRPLDTLPEVCESLARIPFAGALTPNWDKLLERTFDDRSPVVVLSSHSEAVEKAISGQRFFVIKLYGDPMQPETFRFTPGEYEYDLFENRTYSKFLTSLFLSRTVFFVGVSLKGVDDFLSGLKLRDMPTRPHFVLVPRTPDWTLQEELFREKYGVRLLGYQPTPGFPQVPAFIKHLSEQVAERAPSTRHAAEIREATLNHVTLKNIGVFEELDLQLNEGWNVLLGNNGCGKSTLLKAVALGLCGDDEQAADAGQWLLRVGATSGSIRLRVGESEYLTELFRETDDRVRVRCGQLTPLQKGNWVVLGFPAMRGVSTRNPAGPAGKVLRRPVVHDLLPLIKGAVDHRMDNLKQWVVNIDAGAVPGGDNDAGDAERNQRLRAAFFELLRQVSPKRLRVEFGRVERKNDWQVMVKVDGILVPLDQVSQGMSSIFGWVGTLLQRMYEIHRDHEHPERQPALVLVDEIDAHLHPEWQQLLVPLVKNHFPRLQLIATTHSPLLVAGMKSAEVFITKRDLETGRVVVIPAPVEFEGMRSDQILTSPAFGLSTARSLDTRDAVELYGELKGRKVELERRGSSLSNEERLELAEIDERLPVLEKELDQILQVGTTPTRRKVERAVRRAVSELPDADYTAQERTLTPEVELEIKKQLDEIFNAPK